MAGSHDPATRPSPEPGARNHLTSLWFRKALVQHIRIVNFEKHQHYRDRKPPWIKLYRDLWRDPRFFALTESQRYQLISLFVLASQNDNLIKIDQQWLRHELATSKAVELNALVASGFIEVVEQDASIALAERKQDAIVETETEIQRQNTETETEVQIACVPVPVPIRSYGEFESVRLSDDEIEKLRERLNGSFDELLTDLDLYSQTNPAKFKAYKSHYATLLAWYQRRQKGNGNGTKLRTYESEAEARVRRTREASERLLARMSEQDGGGLPH